jgi:hypothetical protein
MTVDVVFQSFMRVFIKPKKLPKRLIRINILDCHAQDQIFTKPFDSLLKLSFLNRAAVIKSNFVSLVLLTLLQLRQQQMRPWLVQFVFLTEVEHQLPRLIKCQPQTHKHRQERWLAIEHYILSQGFADAHSGARWFDLILLLVLVNFRLNFVKEAHNTLLLLGFVFFILFFLLFL